MILFDDLQDGGGRIYFYDLDGAPGSAAAFPPAAVIDLLAPNPDARSGTMASPEHAALEVVAPNPAVLVGASARPTVAALDLAAPDPVAADVVFLESVNTEATYRLSSSPDLEAGDGIHVVSVTGGARSELTINDDATFSLAEGAEITSFVYRVFDPDDNTLGDPAEQVIVGPAPVALIEVAAPDPAVRVGAATRPAAAVMDLVAPDPAVRVGARAAPGAAILEIIAVQPFSGSAAAAEPDTAVLDLEAPDPRVSVGVRVSPPVAALELIAPTPEVRGGTSVAPPAAEVDIFAPDPVVAVGVKVVPNPAVIEIVGRNPRVRSTLGPDGPGQVGVSMQQLDMRRPWRGMRVS